MYGTKETLLCNILKHFIFNLPRFYVVEKVLFRRFKARLCLIRVLSVILPVCFICQLKPISVLG